MNVDKGKKTTEKYIFFSITQDYYLVQEKDFLRTLKADYLQQKIQIKFK